MLYDELLLHLGDFGKYQKFQVFLLCVVAFTSSFHSMNMVFISATPKHHCKPIPAGPVMNTSDVQVLINWTIPRDSKGEEEKCKMFSTAELKRHRGNLSDWLMHNHTLRECEKGWTYHQDVYRSTIVSQWDLVCKDTWRRSLASSLFFVGRLSGAFCTGLLSDKFGRRPIFLIAVILQVSIGCAASFSPNLYLFYVLYLLQGVVQEAVYLCAYIIGTELVAPTSRKVPAFLDKVAYSGGQMMLCLIAFGLRDWRLIELTISLVSVIYFSYYWLLPESTRWLLTQGRHEDAKRILRKVAKINKTPVSEHYLETLRVVDRRGKIYTVIDLLRGWKMAKMSLIVWFNCMVSAMAYYGLNINTRNLAGDPYLNFLISAIVELPPLIFCLVWLDKFGRRKSYLFFSFMGGISCGITAFAGNKIAVIVFAMIGKLAICGSYGIIYLLAAEVFPTVARNVGVGFSSVCAKTGGMLAPQILLLGDHIPFVPLVLFGLLCIIGPLLAFFLPEPTGKPLPQTFEDIFGKPSESNNDIKVEVALPLSPTITAEESHNANGIPVVHISENASSETTDTSTDNTKQALL